MLIISFSSNGLTHNLCDVLGKVGCIVFLGGRWANFDKYCVVW